MHGTPDRIDAFIARWSKASGNELANYQLFLTELTELLGVQRPEPAGADHAHNAALYYNQVVDGRRPSVDEFHERNRRDPSAVLEQQIEWWRATPAPPSGEDRTFHESAPLIHRLLTRDNVQRLTPDDVVSICNATHSTRDYILKIGLEKMGLVGVNSMGRAERTDHYGRWILGRRNRRGESFPQLLAFVLYGGEDGDIWRRIYDAAYDDSRAIGHYGLNSIAEVVGWARPEVCYPRNGRTSKALRALGFEVVDY